MHTLRNILLGTTLLLVLLANTPIITAAQDINFCAAGEAFPPFSTQSLDVDGLARNYDLYVSPTYNANRPRPIPLVISFHGGGMTAATNGWLTGWGYLGWERGFITIMPEGINGAWNDGFSIDPEIQARDDVAFVQAILDDVSARLCIDQNRVFLTGISAGGAFVQHVACELPEQFAAVGIGSIRYTPEALDCESRMATPVILFHGTEDVVAPFAGGPYPNPNGTTLELLPVEDAVALWAEKNGCSAEPLTEQVTDHVHNVQYHDCDNDADVVLYIVEGGGHTWPGSAVDLQRLIPPVGVTTQEIDATRLMWEFFQDHNRTDIAQD